MEIAEIVKAQRDFFSTGATKSGEFRRQALLKLRDTIVKRQPEIYAAVKADLNKSEFEAYMTEVGMVLDELRYVLKHINGWSKRKYVPTPLAQFPSVSFITPEPYGVVLIMSPWNYPFELNLSPLIGAIAAGNCSVVKPSSYAPKTSRVLADIISACFPPKFVAVVEGGHVENEALLKQRFDFILFTGGTTVGKVVMESAAKNLTPVCLELGGKSPCIVDKTADLKTAARRIAFGKYLNAGQICISPDYAFVHSSVKDAFVGYLREAITEFFGDNPLDNPDYPRIINKKHFDRLNGLLKGEHILIGGNCDGNLGIAPTVIDGVTSESPIMKEEIFGPILPVIPYEDPGEAAAYIAEHEKPLALYLFTKDKSLEKRILNSLSFGGGCVNDTIIHIATVRMGFGGVGFSGMGSYRGRYSFDTFSHYKGIVRKSFLIDLPMRYQPYTEKKLKLIKRFLH